MKVSRSQRQVGVLASFMVVAIFVSQNSVLSAAGEVWPQLESRHFFILDEPARQPATMSLSDWDVALTQYVEQLDEELAPLFGGRTLAQTTTTRGQKPILLICASQVSYMKKLAEYGAPASDGSVAHSGGFYHPASNVIFIWRQPTDYYSRHVVLHEVAHWYCLQLLGPRYEKMPLWLCEGLADFAATHTWDGKKLHVMQTPRVSLENYPGRLDALLKRLPGDLCSQETQDESSPSATGDVRKSDDKLTPESIGRCFAWLRSDANGDKSVLPYDEYALAWGLVAFLVEEHSGEMTNLFDSLTRHDMAECWELAFPESQSPNPGAPLPTWSQFAGWTVERQLPWRWVWNHWEDNGRQFIGVSDSTALIVQNATAPSDISNDQREIIFGCEIEPLLEGTVIGLVFNYESSERFEMLQFRHVGPNIVWRHVRFAQKKWEPLSSWQTIAKATPDNISIRKKNFVLRCRISSDASTIRFYCEGHLVVERENGQNSSDGQADHEKKRPAFGLAVQSGAAKFRICSEAFSGE